MKKKLTRLFSVLLAAVLVLGTLPVSAEGEGGTSKDVSVVVGGTEIVTLENKTIDEDDIGEVKDNTIAKVGVTSEKVTVPTYEQVKDKTYATNTDYYVSTESNATEPVGPIQFVTFSSNKTWVKYNNAYITLKKGSYGTDSESGSDVTINAQDDGTFQIYRTSENKNKNKYYLTASNSAFGCSTDNPVSLYLYTKNENPGTRTDTTITFTGVAEGSTSVTIGGVTYNITVTKEDLEDVTPLTIEYWITNTKGTDSNEQNCYTINASDEGIATEEGVDITTFLPATVTSNGREQAYWKANALDATKVNKTDTNIGNTELQCEQGGDDETYSGSEFTKIRYYGGKWQYCTTENSWETVDTTQVTQTYYVKGTTTSVTANYVGNRTQLAAYYMEQLDIANNDSGDTELKVNAADWGIKGNGGNWGYKVDSNRCSVSVQIVYEEGTNPEGNDADSLKSKTFLYGQSANRGIGTMIFNAQQDYVITKISATTGQMTSTADSDDNVTLTSLAWNDDETTVWGGNGDEAKSASIYNPNQDPDTTNKKNLTWIMNTNNAILIRVYLKTVETPESLTVHYIDATNNDREFYKYFINAKAGTEFDGSFGLENGALVHNDVPTPEGTTRYVQSDLTQLTEIGAQYRYSDYTCIDAKLSDDKKAVYLYYTFSNAASFVIDFGTSLTLKPTDINTKLGGEGVSITGVTVNATDPHGTVETGTNNSFTYTPNSKFVSSESGETLNVTYTGKIPTEDGNEVTQSGSVTYNVYILPASNVLYEEGFLSEGEKPANAQENEWSMTTATTTTQQTQKACETGKNVFGFDETYVSSTGANGTWSISGLEVNQLYTPLTTTFYGNTFDLIGNCGTDTGRIVLIFKNADGKYERVVDILDTRYTKDTIYQVPLAHVTLGKGKDAEHTVLIYASGLEEETITNAAMNAASPASLTEEDVEEDEFLAAVLEENGIDISDVDYVQTTVMDELESLDASETSASLYSTMLTTDNGDSDTETNSSGKAAGTHVDIAGFRVYRTTTTSENVDDDSKTAADYYPTEEQNIEYVNILEAVGETVTAVVDTEDGVVTNYDVEKYEDAGGPQNEIYLKQDQSVTIQLKNKDGKVLSKPIQVSLRAVSSETSWSMNTDSTEKVIKSNTEMYYTITPDEDGVVTITNKGKGLLALGNVKFDANTKVVTASNMAKETVLASLRAAYGVEEPETFTPNTFTVKTTSTKLVTRKVITLKINVSSDVAYVTVNGKKYTRTGLQSASKNTRTIRVIDSASKSAEKTYEIIAYNSDGVASEVITKTVK